MVLIDVDSTQSISVGIDAQPRGLAVAQLDLETGNFIAVDWYPTEGITLEEKIYNASIVASSLAENLKPALTTIELPTAIQSSSSMSLWGICGAVIAAFYPYSGMCEGIVVTSWKKYSGLNKYGKLNNKCSKRGVIEKKFIPECIVALIPEVPSDLSPADIYDSIAIAKAGYERNLERFNRLDSST